MAKLHWAIQTNLGKEDSAKILKACKETGYPAIGLMAVPFFCPLPELPTDVPTVFWGAIGFVRPIWESKKWTPGVVFNENFTYEVWSKAWGEHCLNHGARVTTLKEFSQAGYAPDSLHFIRPCADDKSFVGQVIEFGEVEEWMRNVMGAGLGFENTPISISEPVGISREWRVYLLNGRAMSASLYKQDFRSKRTRDVPREVIEFAERMAAIWSPAPLFCLDVAESAGELYVNEMGCFHSCGLYESDVTKIVSDLGEYYSK